MTPADPTEKPALPHRWQRPVSRAIDDLMARLGVPRHAVAVGWAEEIDWLSPGEVPREVEGQLATDGRGLDVRLVSGARTYRYLIPLPDGEPIPSTAVA